MEIEIHLICEICENALEGEYIGSENTYKVKSCKNCSPNFDEKIKKLKKGLTRTIEGLNLIE